MAKGKWLEWETDEKLSLLSEWAKKGLTDAQIAKNMGISLASLYNYKKDHLDIFDALKKGKQVADTEVENALYKRACGYEYEETITELWIGKDGKESGKHVKRLKKHMPADTTAEIYWLNNRQPMKWKNRREYTNEEDVKKIQDVLDEVKSAID